MSIAKRRVRGMLTTELHLLVEAIFLLKKPLTHQLALLVADLSHKGRGKMLHAIASP
jgi:hypothetical protein